MPRNCEGLIIWRGARHRSQKWFVSFFVAFILAFIYAKIRRPTTMPDSLAQMEQQRSELFRQIAQLGDFRRGSVTTTSGKLCPAPGPWPRTQLPPHPQA